MARVLFTAGLAVAGSTAHAAVWDINGQCSGYAGYDDNVRLSLTDVPATNYAGVDAALHLALDNQAWSWSADPRSVLMRYQNYSVLNRTENYLASSLQRQTDTSSSVLSLNWTQDTTLTSELGQTGFAEANKRHQATALTLTQLQQWTERFSTQGSLYTVTNHYMDAAQTGLVNYNYGSAQLGLQYALSARSQLSLDSAAGKLQVPGFAMYGKTNRSVMLSYTTTFAERWQVKISAGPSQVRSDFSADSGTVYEFDVTRKSEISTLQLKLSRDITPTGQGILARRQQWSLGASRELSERWSASLKGAVTKNDNLYLANDFTALGVRYEDVSVNVNWRWTPTVTLTLNTGHAEQRLQDSQRAAKRNYSSLTISWTGLAHTLH